MQAAHRFMGDGQPKAPFFPQGWIRYAMGALFGSAFQLQLAELWSVAQSWAMLGGAVAVWALAWVWGRLARPQRAPRLAKTGIWLLGAVASGILVFALTNLRASAFAQTALNPVFEGRDIDVVGVIVQMPQRNPNGLRFRLAVESSVLDGSAVVLPPLIDVGWYGGFSKTEGGLAELQMQALASGGALMAGERWQLRVRLKAPHGTRNPHGFDFELWMWEQGVQATGYVRATARDPAPRMLGQLSAASAPLMALERKRQGVRDAIFASIADGGSAGLVAALVVGDQRAIERADWDVFRATGVAHLMSISGLHVTLFAWMCGVLFAWAWRASAHWTPRLCLAVPAPLVGALSGLAAAWAYALFSGWGLPAQRTVYMLLVVVLLRATGQRLPWPQVWLAACAAVVALDPWSLLQAGFWLSFVAVGVLFAGTGDQTAQKQSKFATETVANKRRGYWTMCQKVGEKLRSNGQEQLLITASLAPLSLLFFQQVSVVGLVANSLAIPWVTLVVTPLAMAGVVFSPFWDVAAASAQLMRAVLAPLAAWPWATLNMPAPPPVLAVAAVLGGVLLALRLPWPLRSLGLVPVLAALFWQPARPAHGEFEVMAVDIGQGNAVLVRTAQHSLLYDAGPMYSQESDAGHRVIVPLLRAKGERLDALMLSHRDADHTGGAAAVLGMQTSAQLHSSLEDGHVLLGLRPNPVRCIAGQSWVWDGVEFSVLHPAAADYPAGHVAGLGAGKTAEISAENSEGKGTRRRSNAMSCVLKVRTARAQALLAGDIEAEQEAQLLQNDAAALKSDWLLVPHHGSKTSSTPGWVAAVAPRFAVVQAGYRNRYGHPVAGVLERYAAVPSTLVGSSACGASLWKSWEKHLIGCERQVSRRYWQHGAVAPAAQIR